MLVIRRTRLRRGEIIVALSLGTIEKWDLPDAGWIRMDHAGGYRFFDGVVPLAFRSLVMEVDPRLAGHFL
jgi:hypothetical protein